MITDDIVRTYFPGRYFLGIILLLTLGSYAADSTKLMPRPVPGWTKASSTKEVSGVKVPGSKSPSTQQPDQARILFIYRRDKMPVELKKLAVKPNTTVTIPSAAATPSEPVMSQSRVKIIPKAELSEILKEKPQKP
jgi:hypothetical protein